MSDIKNKALVFYARDFLATEFPKLGSQFRTVNRVYIVLSEAEKKIIQSKDLHSQVYVLKPIAEATDGSDLGKLDVAVNNDRFLRYYSSQYVKEVVCGVEQVIADILRMNDVVVYMDEPVSAYPNYCFNKAFGQAGALCLHFQASWLPGYMFFSSDSAQADLPYLNAVNNGLELATAHVQQRKNGLAKPVYVINYAGLIPRIRDAATVAAKGLYRKVLRRAAYYLDRDTTAHFFHCRCLLASFKGGYLQPSQAATLQGKYVMFPLHYEPEAVLNYMSPFTRQVEIAERLLDTLPNGYELIIKEHPSQPGALNLSKWRDLTRSRRVLKVAGTDDAKFFLSLDMVVVSIGSTLALEAAVAGRPVGVLGDVHFANMPGIRRLKNPEDWLELLDHPAPVPLSEIVQWYGDFINRYCFAGNFMKGRTDSTEVHALVKKILQH